VQQRRASGSGLSECVCSHAEENANHAGRLPRDRALRDAGALLHDEPVPDVRQEMIINAGIREVIFEEEYHFAEQTEALFVEAGVRYRRLVRKVDGANA